MVSEVGYRSASVAKIIERAGVSRKTFYELFGDRAACFAAAHVAAASEIDAAIMGEDGLAALIDLYGRRPEVFDLVFTAAAVTGPRETEALLKALDRWAERLSELALRAEGELGRGSSGGRGDRGNRGGYPPEMARMAFGGLVTALCRSGPTGGGAPLALPVAAGLAALPWLGPREALEARTERLG